MTGYAYETVPGKSILAGQTQEAEHEQVDDNPGGSFLTNPNPVPDNPQPASLGMLALGFQGVPLWRRKESAIEGD